MKVRRYLLAAVLILAAVRPTEAHRPRLVEDNGSPGKAYRIDDPDISWAFYADLESATRVEYYTFRLEKRTLVEPELLVPNESMFDGFEPTFLIYAAAFTQTADAPVALPTGAGYQEAAQVDETEFEGFTRKEFRKTARLSVTLDPGEYGVAIYTPGGDTGEYVFVIGEKEEFNGDDIEPMVRGCGTIFY